DAFASVPGTPQIPEIWARNTAAERSAEDFMGTRSLGRLASLLCVAMGRAVLAAPPALLHTPGFGIPESGEPGRLLLLAGDRLSASDQIVYQAVDPPGVAPPRRIPDESTETLGTAAILQVGESPSYLTAKLPGSMAAGTIYRLWAVNSAN